MKHESLTDTALAEAASRFSALGSEHRLLVLQILVRAGKDGLSIGELGQRSGITGATLTHHMKILAQAGLVTQQRAGRSIICVAAAYDEMAALSEFLLKNCCADAPPSAKGHDHG